MRKLERFIRKILSYRLYSRGEEELKEVKCPECGAALPIPEDVMSGEIISCPDCGMDFEVNITSDDIELKPAEIEGEDWGE